MQSLDCARDEPSGNFGAIPSLKKLAGLWLPPLLWMGFIYFLSAQPGLKVADGAADFCTRKPAHIAEYGVLFLLLFRAVEGSFRWVFWESAVGAGVLTFLYAITDEFHQIMTPRREGRWYDLVFDFLGIVLGVVFLRWWLKIQARRSPS